MMFHHYEPFTVYNLPSAIDIIAELRLHREVTRQQAAACLSASQSGPVTQTLKGGCCLDQLLDGGFV